MAGKRIGFDVTSALTQGGGIGRYTRELIAALTDIDRGNEYTLFSAKISDPPSVDNPLPTGPHIQYKPAPVAERWLYRFWYRARLPLPVQWVTGGLDLFHSPDFVLPPVAGNIPTILTVHDLSFIHYPETFPETLVTYLNNVVPWSVQRATLVLADSAATKKDLIELWQVPEDKVEVLYSGVSEHFRVLKHGGKATWLRQRYGLGEAPYMLAVGTVQPRKNYQMLIRAFKDVAAHFPHNLVIAGGKGWMEDEMTREVERQGLTKRVIFTGFIDDGDLPALYNSADLYLFPSLYEGFGIPVLEAMACGVPVIIAGVSSLPEVGGDAALQLSPVDEDSWTKAMIDLLEDEERLAAMRLAGFAQVKRFNWRRSAQQLKRIYDRVLP